MILFNMWTLTPPFEGMGAMQIIIEVATNDRRPDLPAVRRLFWYSFLYHWIFVLTYDRIACAHTCT